MSKITTQATYLDDLFQSTYEWLNANVLIKQEEDESKGNFHLVQEFEKLFMNSIQSPSLWNSCNKWMCKHFDTWESTDYKPSTNTNEDNLYTPLLERSETVAHLDFPHHSTKYGTSDINLSDIEEEDEDEEVVQCDICNEEAMYAYCGCCLQRIMNKKN